MEYSCTCNSIKLLNIASILFHSGASIGLVISYSISTLFLIGYIWVRGLHKQTWGGWSWESLNEWGPFLKLAIPGFLMICFESWTFEISVIVTGSIDETQLAVNAILIQLTATAFVVSICLFIYLVPVPGALFDFNSHTYM